MDGHASALGAFKLCLVFPPYRETDDIAFLRSARQNLGAIPPLSLMAVAAAAESLGVTVRLLDANAHGWTLDETIGYLEAFAPHAVGFTLSTYQFHFTLEWIEAVRRRMDVPVIVGGAHATLYPEEVLTHRAIDYCVLGDSETTLPGLLGALAEGTSVADVPSLAYRDEDGTVHSNRRELYAEDLDQVPMPSRHLVDNGRYFSLISRHQPFTAMTTSRGCVFRCTFCDNKSIPYRAMSPKRVVDEMEHAVRVHGIREIDMFDGVFSVKKARLHAICDEIVERGLEVAWSFRTRADLVDRPLLEHCKQAGCIRINYGIESGSPTVLKNIRKDVGHGRIEEAIRETKRAGMEAFGYFMVGNDGETEETIRQTMELMLSVPLDYVQIAPIYYPPNTDIYCAAMERIGEDYWRAYTIDPTYEIEFPILGTSMSRDDIERHVRRMYLRFYLRPRFVLEYLTSLPSPRELLRSGRALVSMIRETIFG